MINSRFVLVTSDLHGGSYFSNKLCEDQQRTSEPRISLDLHVLPLSWASRVHLAVRYWIWL